MDIATFQKRSSAVREIEQRIEQAERLAAASPDYAKPTAIPKDYEQIRVMCDMLALSFETDITRAASR